MKRKLLVLGLDGATFQIIKPEVARGRLPVLARLLEGGVNGVLESTLDTNSPCAWSTFITGKNPGKHGIFGFFENMPKSYDVRFLNGSFRSGKSLWRILSEHEKRVGVINVPFSYPVEEVNGFIIGGPDSPSKRDPKFAYPEAVVKDYEAGGGKYIIEAGANALVRQGRLDLALERMKECIEARTATAKYFLRKGSYDFFMVVFTESDRVQHHFWKYINPHHPAYGAPERTKFESAIFDIYAALDKALGEIIDVAGEDYAVLVMSDHGAGPSSNKTFFLNRWLQSEGYLTFKTNRSIQGYTKGFVHRAIRNAYVFANSRFSRKWKRTLRNLFPGVREKASSIVRGLEIDWDGTKAFSWENAPAIYINLEGKFPSGRVAPGAEYEQIREGLKRKLLELRAPGGGAPIVERVIKKEEVYSGPYLEKAPDLFVEWKNDAYTVRPGFAGQSNEYIEEVTGARLKKVETISRASGVHKPDGTFVFAGAGLERGKQIRPLGLHDVASTILYYLGVPVPSDFDGKVVTEVFREDFLQRNVISYSDVPTGSDAFDVGYTAEESEIIAERLQGLGYID